MSFDFTGFSKAGIHDFFSLEKTRAYYENDDKHDSKMDGPFFYSITNTPNVAHASGAAPAATGAINAQRVNGWNSLGKTGSPVYSTDGKDAKGNYEAEYPDGIYDVNVEASDLHGNTKLKSARFILANWRRTIETAKKVYLPTDNIQMTTGVQYRANVPALNLYIIPAQGVLGTSLISGTALPAAGAQATTTNATGVLQAKNLGTMPAGVYCVVADYNSDGEYTNGLDAYTVIVVNAAAVKNPPPPASLSLSSSLNSSYLTQSVTFTATATFYHPTATPGEGALVFFYDGSTFVTSATADAVGEATFTSTSLWLGDHDISAYLIAETPTGEVSAGLTQTVVPNPTAVGITPSANQSYHGNIVTFVTTVIPSGTPVSTTPIGVVDFYAGGDYLGSADLDTTGVATADIDWLDRGSQTIEAVYSGDSVYRGNSFSIAHTVLNNLPNVWADQITTTANHAVKVRVLKNDYDPDGDDLFVVGVGAPAHGTAELIRGKVFYTPAPGFVGTDTFTYSVGDGFFEKVHSTVTIRVLAAGTGTRVFADTNGNGLQGTGEVGVPYIRVDVIDSTGIVVGVAFTDDNGYYQLPPLPAGDYHLRFVQPDVSGSVPFSPPDQGIDDTIDSDVNAVGETPTFSYNLAQGWPAFDAGVILDPTDPAFSYLFA